MSNNAIKQVETEYVRLDGDNFTVTQTRGQFYGGTSKVHKARTAHRHTTRDREWAAMVRDTIRIERKILKELNVILTPDITV